VEALLRIDWEQTLAPGAVAELVVRGSLVYLGLFVILRWTPNRRSGAVGVTDLLFVVLLVHAAHNALVGEYKSVVDGAVLVLTVVAWSAALDWVAYQFPAVRWLIRPQPRLLVKDGRTVRRNLWRELMTEDELMTQLRLQGIDDLDEVAAARLESDGRISVIPREGPPGAARDRHRV
jgi:uncharacterized membrane protein YcaP (DUF421 family)